MSENTGRLRALLGVMMLLAGLCACDQREKGREQAVDRAEVQVCFSPGGGCTEAIVKELDGASSEIKVQAYSFTSRPIAKALVEAHKRGVNITVLLDKSNASTKYGAADFTTHMGIPTLIDGQHGIAHNKIMVIDRKTVITGSYNFTKAAEEKNAENLLIIRDRAIAELYLNNWENHRAHSLVYRRPEGPS